MCRLCLGENECFINIFDVNDWQGYVAANVICDLLQFQVSETDIYPQVVCSKCLLKLTDFQLFKECCQKSKVMYDNMFVACESLEELKPEMDVGDSGSGLAFCEQDPLKEETSYPIIKPEELDISGDEFEEPCKGTITKVGFGPMLLKHEVLSFNRVSDTQDIGGYRSDSELSEQDPLGDESSHVKLIESGPSLSCSTVKSVATVIDDTSRRKRTIYYRTVDKIKKQVQLLDQYGDEEEEQLTVNVQEYRQSSNDSRKKGVKGNLNKRATSKKGMNTQDASYTCGDHRKSSVSTKRSEHKRPNHASKGEADIDSCTGNIVINDESIFEKSKNISSSSEIETPSSAMMERLDDQSIPSGERKYMIPVLQRGIGVRKERGREGKETGGEDNEGKETAPEKDVKKEIERFKCYHCGNTYRSKQSLKQHMIMHGFGKSYPCDVCDKVFPTVANLNRHVLTHTGSKPHKCVKCSRSFRRSDTLKTHMRSHSGSKPYKCADCSKSFYQIGHLKSHMRLHTGSKPYKCTECSKCFCRSDQLTVHMKTHTGVKPYKCADCSKCFIDMNGLITHIRSHTGSKPYKCVECAKSFSQSSALKSHMRIHAGVKPYKCVQCSKSFRENSALKSHIRGHTGVKPYKCSQCGNCFTRNHHLIIHMRIHTGSKPYKCAECCKCFRDKRGFNKHRRTKKCCKSREVAEAIKSLSK